MRKEVSSNNLFVFVSFLSTALTKTKDRYDQDKVPNANVLLSKCSKGNILQTRRLPRCPELSFQDHGCVPQDLRRQLEAQGARSPDVWSVLLTLQNTLPPTSLANGQIKRGENTPESFNSLTQSQRLHIIGSKLFGIFDWQDLSNA